MPRRNEIGTILISAAIFILMEIAALGILRHNNAIQDIWISRVSHRAMATLWGGTENIKAYFSLKRENESLSLENSDLIRQLASLKAALSDRKEKEKAIDCGEDTFVYIPASIVKISHNSQHNYFILNKGSEDGITLQSGVITDKGAIGIVDAVDKHYSFGLSFMNSALSVSSRIGREGAVGPLYWDGKSKRGALLKEIPLQFKFERGDTVWTSGYSSIFPPDIPLGLTGEAKIINGAVNEIKVELFEDFSALRYVTVVANADRAEIESLEKGEGVE